jgi:hypothetical protein
LQPLVVALAPEPFRLFLHAWRYDAEGVRLSVLPVRPATAAGGASGPPDAARDERRGRLVQVTWLEMPVAYSGDAAQSVGPKYAIVDSAVVLYKKDHAYVGLAVGKPIAELLAHTDVRVISPAELELLLESSEFSPSIAQHLLERPGSERNRRISRVARRIGLGDAVVAITHRLGIHECKGCARRRGILNHLQIRRWRRPHSAHPVPPITRT